MLAGETLKRISVAALVLWRHPDRRKVRMPLFFPSISPSQRTERVVGTVLALFLSLLSACCDEAALPKAIDQLTSSKASDRNKALHTVGRCGTKADRAVPTIERLMYDQNVGVASSAAYALRKIDTPSARAALKAAEQLKRERKK